MYMMQMSQLNQPQMQHPMPLNPIQSVEAKVERDSGNDTISPPPPQQQQQIHSGYVQSYAMFDREERPLLLQFACEGVKYW